MNATEFASWTADDTIHAGADDSHDYAPVDQWDLNDFDDLVTVD
ncbi:MAG: hypothetical protein AAFZ58_01865 [Pseudomonadota bacterium]